MERGDAVGSGRPLRVAAPAEPVEAAIEADASDALAGLLRGDMTLMVRGPLFGVAAQPAGDPRGRWRVVDPVTSGCPQQARDGLNSLLWRRTHESTDLDRVRRRSLLAAVARLETEAVDDLTADGERYRVVRAEEYAAASADGIEGPRPTDPEPIEPDWSRTADEPGVDDGLVLDLDAAVTPSQAAEQLALQSLRYVGDRYPASVRADSERAVATHPDVLLLPPCLCVMESRRGGAWAPSGALHTTAHAARRSLYFGLLWMWPRMHGHIPIDAPSAADASGTGVPGEAYPPETAAALAPYARAAAELRAGPRVHTVELPGTVYRVVRVRRLLRWGPDGPEPPRPSDVNLQQPMRMHPPLDDEGRILPEA